MKTLGSRIRFARGALSQEVFAAKIGVSKGSLGGYERDENLPNTDVVLKICHETGISVQWLLLGEGPPVVPEEQAVAPGKQPTGSALPLPGILGVAAHAAMPQAGIAFVQNGKMLHQECARCRRLEERLERLEDERRELSEENRQLWKENSLLTTRLARMKARG
ncbi:MAG: hypothetical protein DESF_01843 [Desulfovibrio sp.]